MLNSLPKSFGAVLLLSLVSSPAAAFRASVEVGHQADRSDNTARRATDETEEWIQTSSADLTLTHDGPRVRMNADYQYEYRARSEDVFQDDDAFTGISSLTWQALPGRLDFEASNTRTETTTTAAAANTPANRQVTSSTRVGPTLRFRVRDVDELQFQYLYTDSRSDVTDTDSDRNTVTANYVMNVGANDRLTFSALANKVDFENPGAPDLDARTGSVTWQHYGPSVDLEVMVGRTEIERELGRADVEDEIFDATVTWRITPTMSLSLNAAQDLRDNPSILETGALEFGSNLQIDSDLNEVFLNRRASIDWSMTFLNNDIRLGYTFDDEDYIDVLNDVERKIFNASFQRRLSPRLTLTLLGSVGEEDFQDVGVFFDRTTVEALLEYSPGRRLTVGVGASHDDRESSDPLLSYEENIYTIEFRYLLLE